MGGYDRNRALGPVMSGDLVQDGVPVLPLVGISIGVGDANATGNPFNVSETPNLTAARSQGFPVVLSPAVPYIALPAPVCAALASWLPVSFSPRLGLYLWEASNQRYQAIASSAAELRFTFAASWTANVTIAVPFALLNLTLEAPLADPPAPCFPCQPRNAVLDDWLQGRAFLQAAPSCRPPTSACTGTPSSTSWRRRPARRLMRRRTLCRSRPTTRAWPRGPSRSTRRAGKRRGKPRRRPGQPGARTAAP